MASRPFEPAPHLPPAWHPSAAPLESCSLPAAVRRLAGALALRDVDAPPVCCGLHPRRSRVEGARRRRGWHRASPPSGGAAGPGWPVRVARGAGGAPALTAHYRPNTDAPARAARHARRRTEDRGGGTLLPRVCQLVVSQLIGVSAYRCVSLSCVSAYQCARLLEGCSCGGSVLERLVQASAPRAHTRVTQRAHRETERERARAHAHIPYTLHILSRRTRALTHTPPSAHPSPGGP